jgi:hypothetical protein
MGNPERIEHNEIAEEQSHYVTSGGVSRSSLETTNLDMVCSAHVPLRTQIGCDIILGANSINREAANTVSTGTDITGMGSRDSGSVAANAATIAGRITVLETSWGRKVQRREDTRFPQCMPAGLLVRGKKR